MTTTVALRNELIEKINTIEDEALLNSLIQICEINKDEPYPLTEEQKQSIEKGLEDIKNGNVTSHEKVMRKAGKWLSSKK